ncbi:hypothetical protein RN001_001561 [Aquatica leii]|uniref:Uncharacterized protein n=1 Tax=Aquatica leii TaxID=1421715 RepID=A0AAN7QAH3_9COLE|nr:hypothetical protein RN001_001561 [Aquatica leii]
MSVTTLLNLFSCNVFSDNELLEVYNDICDRIVLHGDSLSKEDEELLLQLADKVTEIMNAKALSKRILLNSLSNPQPSTSRVTQSDCYIDLESSCVTMRADVAEDNGFSFYEMDTEPIIGYGNGQVKLLGLFTANLTIDNVCAKVKIHVVPKNSQQVALIVGHPYTEQSHIVITSKSNKLLIHSVDSEMPNSNCEKIKTSLITNEGVIIPSNYLGRISVSSDLSNYDLCIEVGIREKGQATPRCVVRPDNKGKCVLPILNISEENICINQDTNITRAEVCRDSSNKAHVSREVNKEEITEEEVNSELQGEDKCMLMTFLNNYQNLMAKNMCQVGVTNKLLMETKLNSDIAVYYKLYRLYFSEREQRQYRELRGLDVDGVDSMVLRAKVEVVEELPLVLVRATRVKTSGSGSSGVAEACATPCFTIVNSRRLKQLNTCTNCQGRSCSNVESPTAEDSFDTNEQTCDTSLLTQFTYIQDEDEGDKEEEEEEKEEEDQQEEVIEGYESDE